MATYRVTDPTGRTIKLTGDYPPTKQELEQIFSAVAPEQKQPSMFGNAWSALSIPEQVASQVLSPGPLKTSPPQISPSVLKTLISGTPRVMEETGQSVGNFLKQISPNPPQSQGMAKAEQAMANFLPSLISPESIATAGTLKGVQIAKPLIKGVGRGLARAAEALSGLEYKTPGILTEAATKGGILMAPGAKAASPIYEAAKGGAQVNKGLAKISGKKEFVEKAYDLAEKGKLTPLEALEARKELASMKKTVTGEFFRKATEKFNEISKSVFQEADTVFSKGLRADELRRILPVNKSGGTSIAKTVLSSLLGPIGTAVTSPIVQGTAATAIGASSRLAAPLINNPALSGAAIGQVLSHRKRKKNDK